MTSTAVQSFFPGDVVEVSMSRFGSQRTRTIRVAGWFADVKGGEPGFEGQLIGPGPVPEDAGVWAYDSQVHRVVSRAPLA